MKNTMKRFLTAVLTLTVSLAAYAQNVQVKGCVKDSKGEPVIGAFVTLQSDKTVGAVTDIDGNYVISIPAANASKAVLEASCISYKTVAEPVGKRAVINFELQEDSELLEEVVVVGYGAMRRSDLTGSVTSVKVDENEASHSASLDQMLQGAAAGVDVINNSAAPGAGVSIQIRGMNSLSGSSEPLYVIDGVIMSDAANDAVSSSMEEETNGLMGLNPSDIASIEILKDASATAIYGADGANGVVLITTKQANKEKPVIRFNVGLDYLTRLNRIEVLSFDEYVQFLEDRNDDSARTYLNKIYDSEGNLKVTPVDWQEYAMQNVLNQRYFFSVSGSPKTIKYSFSVGANLQDGIVKSTGVDQYTMRLNVDKTFTKRFTLGTKMNFAYIESQSQQGANSDAVQASASMMKSLLSYRPYISGVQDDDDPDEDEDLESYSGPDKWLKEAKATRKEFRITPTLYAKFKIADWVSFKSQIGGDFRSSERTSFKGYRITRTFSNAGVSNNVNYRWSWDNTFDFAHKIKKHSISGTLGMTFGQDNSIGFNEQATKLIQEALMTGNINSSDNATTTFSNTVNSRASFFVRGIYNYADRYVLTATYRLDGSSKFTGNNRFAGFPSLAAAWRINQEPWFVVPAISTAKLRIGWGKVGKSSVTAYQVYNTYSTSSIGNHTNDAEYSSGIQQSNFSNEDLKWETTEQWNAGLDFAMFKGRLALTVDAYYKTTYDLLQSRNVPLASGYSTRWVNQGTILNKGLEISIDTVPVKTRNFEWDLSGNISFNRNTLQSLGFAVDEKEIYIEQGVRETRRYYLGSNIASSKYMKAPANIFIEGMPLGLFYGYKTDGIVQVGETGTPMECKTDSSTGALIPQQPGQIKYVDMNGDGIINDDDRTIIGDMNPKFTYGFKTSFSLFRFTLSASFNGVYGKSIINANNAQLWDYTWTSCTNVLRDAYLNCWTPENPTNKYTSLKGWTNSEELAIVTDRYVQDASYLRLSLLSLTYDFKIPKKSKIVRGLTLGASCSNVFILTDYDGWSPLVNSFGKSMQRMGIDLGSYPTARGYSFDVKLRF